jgi:hypothetical protein
LRDTPELLANVFCLFRFAHLFINSLASIAGCPPFFDVLPPLTPLAGTLGAKTLNRKWSLLTLPPSPYAPIQGY